MRSFFKNTKYWKRPPLNKLGHWQQVPQNQKIKQSKRRWNANSVKCLETAVAISKNYIRTLLFNLLIDVVFSAVKSIIFGFFLNENVALVSLRWGSEAQKFGFNMITVNLPRWRELIKLRAPALSQSKSKFTLVQIFNSVTLTVFLFRYCKMEKK